MKRMMRRMYVAVLVMCMMATMLLMPVTTNAATTSGTTSAKRFNIMLVIDGSGSLISASTTDPDGMRYELIDDLLGVLEDEGHHVGAVVFSGNRGYGTSDADMQSGILCNTGMISLDPDVMTPNGSLPKDYISQEIRKAYVDTHVNGKTDVGTALLVAERELQKAQKQNGLESLVFLFTDGVTDLIDPAVKAMAEENLATATREIRENNIRLFGAFLNKGGKLVGTQMTDIVCSANGVSANSQEFLDSYVELTDAASCHEAVNTLLKFLGYLDGPMPEPTTGTIEDEFFIPGIGVEEMNIRLYSYNGENLPDMKVELTMPDGTVLSGVTLNGMCRSSRTIRVYKLADPMSGLWKLRVTVPENNKIAYVYSRIFSKHVDAQLKVEPDVSKLFVNTNTDFTASLSQNGVIVTDPLAYTGYECRLEFQNQADGTVSTYPIVGNGTEFVYNMDLQEYGAFKARVIFTCDSFAVESEYALIELFNHEPETNSPICLRLKCGLLQEKETEVNLMDYINDPEDGKNVIITPISASCDEDAYTYDTGTHKLVIKNKQVDDAKLIFHVTDTQGASAELRFEVQTVNVTFQYVLYVLLVLLVLFILYWRKKVNESKRVPDGDLTVSFELRIDEEKKSIDLLLPIPGREAPSKTNLSELLKKCLEDDSERHQGVTSERIKDALQGVQNELKKVQVSKTVVRVRDEKVGGVVITAGKKQGTMPGKRSVNITVGEMDMTLVYARAEEDDDLFDDDFDFDTPKKEKKDKKGKRRSDRDFADFDDDF